MVEFSLFKTGYNVIESNGKCVELNKKEKKREKKLSGKSFNM